MTIDLTADLTATATVLVLSIIIPIYSFITWFIIKMLKDIKRMKQDATERNKTMFTDVLMVPIYLTGSNTPVFVPHSYSNSSWGFK